MKLVKYMAIELYYGEVKIVVKYNHQVSSKQVQGIFINFPNSAIDDDKY